MNIWGPLSRFGLFSALVTFAIDQAHKYWSIHVYDIAARGFVKITPFLDLVMIWNKGISYGLFQQHTGLGRFVLVGFNILTVVALIFWMARARHKLLALALGLVIGGALGNALDRIVYGAVADFFSLHAFGFRWYVFNLADVAIVAGVALLLYDTVTKSHTNA